MKSLDEDRFRYYLERILELKYEQKLVIQLDQPESYIKIQISRVQTSKQTLSLEVKNQMASSLGEYL